MKTGAWIVMLLLLALWVPQAHPAGNSPSAQINWFSYAQAQQNHKGERKYFIYFYTDQCPACLMLKKSTFMDASVIDYINRNYTPIKVNANKNPKLASQYRIQGVPDLRFLSPEGKDISRWVGYIDSKHLLTLLKYIETDSYLEISYKEFIKQQEQ